MVEIKEVKNSESLNFRILFLSEFNKLLDKVAKNKINLSSLKSELIKMNLDIKLSIKNKNSAFLKLDIICNNLDLFISLKELSSALLRLNKEMIEEVNSERVNV